MFQCSILIESHIQCESYCDFKLTFGTKVKSCVNVTTCLTSWYQPEAQAEHFSPLLFSWIPACVSWGGRGVRHVSVLFGSGGGGGGRRKKADQEAMFSLRYEFSSCKNAKQNLFKGRFKNPIYRTNTLYFFTDFFTSFDRLVRGFVLQSQQLICIFSSFCDYSMHILVEGRAVNSGFSSRKLSFWIYENNSSQYNLFPASIPPSLHIQSADSPNMKQTVWGLSPTSRR